MLTLGFSPLDGSPAAAVFSQGVLFSYRFSDLDGLLLKVQQLSPPELQKFIIQTIGTTSEAIMISALAGSHILHINSASVSEMLSQANRPTSTVTNKHIQESQMV